MRRGQFELCGLILQKPEGPGCVFAAPAWSLSFFLYIFFRLIVSIQCTILSMYVISMWVQYDQGLEFVSVCRRRQRNVNGSIAGLVTVLFRKE